MKLSKKEDSIVKQNIKNSEALFSNNDMPHVPYMEVPEPKVSISKRFDNTVRLRIGGGSVMHPKLRAPTEIQSMNQKSIFNPTTNYEIEKSEHVDMSMNSQSMDMGNPLLDQSNDLQEF